MRNISKFSHAIKRRRFMGGTVLSALALSVAGSAGLWANTAMAAAYPEKPITMIVPFTAGGGYDSLARMLSERMQAELGQNIVVENRPGAGGAIGANAVARAKPDGYTILLGSTGSNMVLQYSTPNLAYDPSTDFEPIGQVTNADFLLVTPSVSPYHTLTEMLDTAGQEDDSVSYMSTGVKGAIHISHAYLFNQADVSMVHVPYPGEAASMSDLLANRVNMASVTVGFAAPFIEDGTLRPLAALGAERAALFPDLPTVAEQGFPDFAFVTWTGMFAPADTPEDIVAALNNALNSALQDEEMIERLLAMGHNPAAGSVEEFNEFMDFEGQRWAKMAAESGALDE